MSSTPEPVLTMPRRSFVDPAWLQDQAEARANRLTVGQLRNFKRRHHLPQDQRLSPAARQLLELEQETAERVAKGEQVERAQALALIAKRATPEAAAGLAAAIPDQSALFDPATRWVCGSTAEGYLLNRVSALTGKTYATAGAAWKRAAALAPAAASAAPAERFRRILFWGVILRLDQLEGPPPADPVAFYSWSQLDAYGAHGSTNRSLGDLLAGRIGSAVPGRGVLRRLGTSSEVPLDGLSRLVLGGQLQALHQFRQGDA